MKLYKSVDSELEYQEVPITSLDLMIDLENGKKLYIFQLGDSITIAASGATALIVEPRSANSIRVKAE